MNRIHSVRTHLIEKYDAHNRGCSTFILYFLNQDAHFFFKEAPPSKLFYKYLHKLVYYVKYSYKTV